MHRSFFSSNGLIQRSSTVLAQHLTRYSITKLVAVILSHLAMLSSLTILNKATVVLAMTPLPSLDQFQLACHYIHSYHSSYYCK